MESIIRRFFFRDIVPPNNSNSVTSAMPIDTEKLRNNVYEMQQKKYELFKAQNPQTGYFDVKFELEGKYIYAHKFILAAVSETLNAWLSDRWTTSSNDPIKIETYPFDVFYQLCCFLYSGGCSLTKENIFQLIDAAEFFGLQLLKNDCEEFLLKLKIVDENNIFDMEEFAEKYSLLKFAKYVDEEFNLKLKSIINGGKFLHLKKFQVLRLCEVQQKSTNDISSFLESLFKWSERQTQNEKNNIEDETFNSVEAVKKQFQEFLSYLNYDYISSDYLIKFIETKPFLFSISELHKVIPKSCCPQETEKFFKAACHLTEYQIKQNIEISTDNVAKDVLKKEMSEFLVNLNFSNVSFDFVRNYVVQKSYLFSSENLYNILSTCNRSDDEEEQLFNTMYKTATKNVLRKQKTKNIENFNPTKAINAELAQFLPNIRFYLMDNFYRFILLVENGIISIENTYYNGNIKVQIVSGDNSLFAIFQDRYGIFNAVTKNRQLIYAANELEHSFDHLKFTRPEAQSEVKKSQGIKWYLCLSENGILSAKHHSLFKENDYLIAEMKYNIHKKAFCFDKKRYTDIYFFVYNFMLLFCVLYCIFIAIFGELYYMHSFYLYLKFLCSLYFICLKRRQSKKQIKIF